METEGEADLGSADEEDDITVDIGKVVVKDTIRPQEVGQDYSDSDYEGLHSYKTQIIVPKTYGAQEVSDNIVTTLFEIKDLGRRDSLLANQVVSLVPVSGGVRGGGAAEEQSLRVGER